MPTPKRKTLPSFSTEEQERTFWASHDSTDYVDWSTARRRAFPNLKPTLRTISLRLPEAMIGQLKVLANKRDIPYQSLLKQFLAERLQRELAKTTGA
jgi:predicted DNA binding CopG/RHH family protein